MPPGPDDIKFTVLRNSSLSAFSSQLQQTVSSSPITNSQLKRSLQRWPRYENRTVNPPTLYIHYIHIHSIVIHTIHRYIYIYIYIRIYINRYIDTYLPTYIHAYIHTYIHTHTYTHTYIHNTYIHTYIHTKYIHTYIHA